MKTLVLALGALGLLSATAFAQTPITFAQVDVDGDGRLSFEELQSVWPDITQNEFGSADTDALGAITPQQLDTLQSIPPDVQGEAPDAPLELSPAETTLEAPLVPAPSEASPPAP